jgi:transcriptional antiterminator NusG
MTPATDSMNEAELAEAEASQDVVEGEATASAAADQAESAAEDAVQANEAEAMVPEPSDEPAEGAESAEVHADEESAPAEPVEEEPAEPEQEQAAAEEGELAGEQAAAEEAEATELPSEVEPTDGAAADVTEAEGGAEEGEEEAEPPVPEPDDGRAWYVVHCYSGDEEKVKHNLEQRTETMQMSDQIFQVVVPTEDEIEIRNGKRRTVERRVFPGYILVQMLLTDDSWYVVRNTPGVTGFVGMGNEPTPLRPEEVQAIVRRMEVEAPKIKVTFKPGQKVRIIDGPFNEFIGVVDEIDMERAKVRVLVSFFGRETPVELDFLQVEKT